MFLEISEIAAKTGLVTRVKSVQICIIKLQTFNRNIHAYKIILRNDFE